MLTKRIFNGASLEVGKYAKYFMKGKTVTWDDDLIGRETWLPTKLDWRVEHLHLLTHNYN